MSEPSGLAKQYGIARDIVPVTPGTTALPRRAMGLFVQTGGIVLLQTKESGEPRQVTVPNNFRLDLMGITHVFATAEIDGATVTATASGISALIP